MLGKEQLNEVWDELRIPGSFADAMVVYSLIYTLLNDHELTEVRQKRLITALTFQMDNLLEDFEIMENMQKGLMRVIKPSA